MSSVRIRVLLVTSLLAFSSFMYSLDLSGEYSNDEFRKGVRAYHSAEYEQAIVFFLKSLGYKNDNHEASVFLGASYRKAGHDKNALFVWDALSKMGYFDRALNNKVNYINLKRGILSEVNSERNYLLRVDLRGFYGDNQAPLFIKPAQIVVGSDNHYYIASFLTGTVLKLDKNLNSVRNYTTVIPKLGKPFGVAVRNDGKIYISDFENDRILLVNEFNIVEREIGYKGIGVGGLLGPKYIILDRDQNLFVTDSGNKRINKYDSDGNILFGFGNNENTYKFSSPSGMKIHNDKLYVCDRDVGKIVVFDRSGNYIESITHELLVAPNDLAFDSTGRMLVICQKRVIAYDSDRSLWTEIDVIGNRLERGISIVIDNEKNIAFTDFTNSRFFILSQERERYMNMNISIERVITNNFPEVHVLFNVEKPDLTTPLGLNETNFNVYENGRPVKSFGLNNTIVKNTNSDVIIVFDNNTNFEKHRSSFNKIVNSWFKDIDIKKTRVSMISCTPENGIVENDFNDTRLLYMDTVDKIKMLPVTDKGAAVKLGIYNAIKRFSRKTVVLVTNGKETGRDFNRFKIEEIVSIAKNNDIKIIIVAFEKGALDDVYRHIAKETGGEYYNAYSSGEIASLFTKIEKMNGKEFVLSYRSSAISRFKEEPVKLQVDIGYTGMKGSDHITYYP